MLPYVLSIFVSALLVFQVQPTMGRYLLPWFGGGAAVWSACLLFFQIGLFLAYAYAHLVRTLLSRRQQVMVHLGLVALSLFFLPLTPEATWAGSGSHVSVAGVAALLAATVGVPYLVVCSTSPLLQHWFTISDPDRSPYRLYSVSNLGSLLGLATYPVLIEPYLGLNWQSRLWSAAYALCCVLLVWVALRTYGRQRADGGSQVPSRMGKRTPVADRLLWLVLAACGTILLLATTSQVCTQIAVTPFLWILPLSLYLISFIICFAREGRKRTRLWGLLYVPSIVSIGMILNERWDPSVILQVLLFLTALFVCCMVCHGELVRLKPPGAQLTSFYLMVALGGALGGVFVNLVAPRVFGGYWELQIGLFLTFLVIGLSAVRSLGPEASAWQAWSSRVLWSGAGGFLLVFLLGPVNRTPEQVAAARDFFGVVRVFEFDAGSLTHNRSLWHGPVSHGEQFLTPGRRLQPTTYYGPESGVGLAIRFHPRRSSGTAGESHGEPRGLRVGAIGLGAGTIAAYGRPGDVFRFYEISPSVVELSEKYFSFLSESQGRSEIVVGDGRISLEHEAMDPGKQGFDVLALDAFSGGSIPVHLLTREAFEVYFEHLQPDGILAVHISGQHFDLSPVVRAVGQSLGRKMVHIENDAAEEDNVWESDWVLLTDNQEFLSRIGEWANPFPETRSPVLWTDDFSSLLSILR